MIVPTPIRLNGPVMVRVDAMDPDNDPVMFRHQWIANGHPVEGQTSPSLDPHMLKRGQTVLVEVVPSDGRMEGPPFRTDPVLVANTPPEVRAVAPENSAPRAGERIRLKVESFDADEDDLHHTYRWWRNSTLVLEGETSELETAGFARGDTIVVEVTPHDASSPGRPRMSEAITIGNSPPSITSIPPGMVNQGVYEYTVGVVDSDGDHLSYSLEKAPPGMTIDKTTGRIHWELAVGISGSHRVKVLIEDGQGGQAFQEFDLSVPSRPSS
jgi:hypothetical protein